MENTKRNSNWLSFPMLFDDGLSRDLFNFGNRHFSDTNTTIPAVNIRETGENFEVEVAAPGMEKKDFKIELNGNILTLSSQKSGYNEGSENEKYSRKEFSYQSFQRSFNLQKEVMDVENIRAKYENGLLQLTIPKKEEAKQKPARFIQIA